MHQSNEIAMPLIKKKETSIHPKPSSHTQRIHGVQHANPLKSLVQAAPWTLFLMLTACGTWRFAAPVENLSIRTPATWSAVKGPDRSIATGWLSDFDPPTMDRVVRQAIANNRDLKAAAARLSQFRERSLIARAQMMPSASISASGSVTDDTGSPRRQAHDIGFSSVWEADLWGRLRDLTQAADSDQIATIEEFRGARLSLAANTAKAWCNLVAASQQVELAREILASFETNERIIERNYKGTGEGALDIQFARTNVSSARRNLESRKLDEIDAAQALEIFLGRYPHGSMDQGRSLPSLGSEVPAGLPSQLLERRPDLAAARARLLASARRADASRKALLPSFALTAAAGTSSTRLSQLLDIDTLVASIAGRLTQPLTEGGALSAQARLALAVNQEQMERYAQAVLGAFREVEFTLNADRSLAKQQEYLQSELEQAALAERLAQRDYTEGINPNILSVLEAQRRANNARSGMIGITNARLLNRIDLHLALGGDFSTVAP